MLKLKKIAVTGALASGKSAVAKLLEESGAHRIDTDEITHQILSSDRALKEKIIHLLGPDVAPHDHIDRRRVAEKVFEDPEKLKKLEDLLHPEILRRVLDEIKSLEKGKHVKIVVVEVPLLFELGWERYFDVTIAVTAKKALCIERYRKLGHTQDEYEKRMARQWPDEKKADRADIVLVNNGDIDELKESLTLTIL